MTLQQLRYFDAACRLKSISRAAASFNVSQPSVSMAIRELEREFGVPLISKRYQGFELTEEGVALQEMTESFLRHAAHISEHMLSFSQRRTVRLGIPPMIGTVLLPVLYKQLDLRYPNLIISTEEFGTKTLINDLQENSLDLAFLTHQAPLPASLDSIPITNMEIVWCALHDHPLSNQSEVSVEQLENEPLVFFRSNFSLWDTIILQFEEAGITPRVFHSTEQLSMIQSLLRSGIATGFLLRPIAETMPEVKAIPLKPQVNIQVSLAWKRSKTPFRDMERLITLCKQGIISNCLNGSENSES